MHYYSRPSFEIKLMARAARASRGAIKTHQLKPKILLIRRRSRHEGVGATHKTVKFLLRPLRKLQLFFGARSNLSPLESGEEILWLDSRKRYTLLATAPRAQKQNDNKNWCAKVGDSH